MNKPQYFKGRPIIQPGEVYDVDDVAYKVITGCVDMLGDNRDGLAMSELTYLLENTETLERTCMSESVLKAKLMCS